ncbi:LOW QUALITY PROTEIN: protein max [Pluvialis apricaria]
MRAAGCCCGGAAPRLHPAGSDERHDDIEVESDEEQPRFQSAVRRCSLRADKRAHHNALERKRRDHIKDSFHSLRDSVPSLQGERGEFMERGPARASRAQILDKATEYIQYMRRKNHTHQQDIDDLKRQNALLEQQVRALEKARSSAQLQANYPSTDNSLYTNPKGSTIAFDGGSDSSSVSEPDEPQSRKKLRYGGQLGLPPRGPPLLSAARLRKDSLPSLVEALGGTAASQPSPAPVPALTATAPGGAAQAGPRSAHPTDLGGDAGVWEGGQEEMPTPPSPSHS